MWNEMSMQHHINTTIKVYKGGLKTVYEPINVSVYLVLNTYMYTQKVEKVAS